MIAQPYGYSIHLKNVIMTKQNVSFNKLIKKYWKDDLLSGFLVSLIALPLSLGIAGASGFPPIMGVLSAIVGGLVVSFFAGSEMTIKGPAAGLIVIIAGGVSELGAGSDENGWRLTLVAVVLAGVLQMVMGFKKVAKLSNYFPIAAIHGMLAAIGIIIMSKQILLAEGISPVLLKGKEPLKLLEMIPLTLWRIEWHIATIGLVSVLIMFMWPFIKDEKIRKIPPALFVIIISIVLGKILHLENKSYSSLSPLINPGSLDFSINIGFHLLNSSNVLILLKYTIMLAIIGSIESLLTGKAIDLLDPLKRKSDLDKDTIAVGLGNIISGIIGGLPMISEVARSSANIANGGKTRWANFFHGFSLLLMVLILMPIIKMIPVAALSGLLIYVGFKLAHPSEFKHMMELGTDQLIIFLVTLISTLATDLLIGIGLGILTKIVINMIDGAKPPYFFKVKFDKIEQNNTIALCVKSVAMFTNWNYFYSIIKDLPAGKHIVVDFTNAKLVDHTFMKSIYQFCDDYNADKGKMELRFNDKHEPKSHHPLSKRVLSV